MSEGLETFVERARGVDVLDVAARYGLKLSRSHAGPCPQCGGRDRFSLKPAENKWYCRGCQVGGKDAIGLAAHIEALDCRTRAGLLAAAAAALGEALPEKAERLSPEAEQARAARQAEAGEKRAERDRVRGLQAAQFRDKAITRARGIYFNAGAVEPGSPVHAYLKARTGHDMPDDLAEAARFSPRRSYWHGRDERGHAVEIHCGPAMILPFVDGAGQVVGTHETFLDLARPPKFRPRLDNGSGEPLPTKKMQGVKKGAVIPLLGLMSASRWCGAEGIESTLALAAMLGFDPGCFFFAAGDLGNLAGPADPASHFPHPDLKKPDAKGRLKAVRVAGPAPKPEDGQDGPSAFVLPDQVRELVIGADGDSEPVMTASAMARLQARLARPGLDIAIWWPPEGMDWADVARAAADALRSGHDMRGAY